MPAVSERQRRFFGAELGRVRAGKKTRTGLGETKLAEFASTVENVSRRARARRHMKSGRYSR